MADLTAQLSELRVSAAGAEPIDLAGIRTTVAAIIAMPLEDSVTGLMSRVRSSIAERRKRVEGLERLRIARAELERRSSRVRSLEFAQELRTAEEAVKAAQEKMSAVDSTLRAIQDEVSAYRKNSPVVSQLAELRALGLQIRRRDGSCPLCGLPISEKDFIEHLSELESEIQKNNADLANKASEELEAKRNLELTVQTLQVARNTSESLLREQSEIDSQMLNLRSQAAALGVDDLHSDGLNGRISELTANIADLETQLGRLQANAALERIAALEKDLQTAQSAAEQNERALQAVSRAENMADQAASIAKRVSGEIIDERLAQLSPLLLELYHRLRPHMEWTDVKYAMRGDVRRFLSLEVGDEINPRFIFSSGQRRSLGIAFLLAVHLSRRWCGLRSVILDDPVQHIDDYRALHFVETLAAIRKTGRQVICAVEDPALADLLCRRLRSNPAEAGQRIEMEYTPGRGVTAARTELVAPFEVAVLVSA